MTRRFTLVDYNKPTLADYDFIIDSTTNQGLTSVNDTMSNANTVSVIASALVVFVLPHMFIYALTGFHPGKSTVAERVWMMSWLVASQLAYIVIVVLSATAPEYSWSFLFTLYKTDNESFRSHVLFVLPLLFLCIPAIGGFVMVGKTYLEFGSCSLSP